MNATELKHKLALKKLVETGVGLVSPKTFDQIRELVLNPVSDIPGVVHMEDNYLTVVGGIKLIKSPFIPDGQIWPFEPWYMGVKTPEHF